MTRTEFIARWKTHVAGLALFGHVSEIQDTPIKRAARVLEIPAEAEKLLGMMYDDLKPKETTNAPGSTQQNGQPANAKPGVAGDGQARPAHGRPGP